MPARYSDTHLPKRARDLPAEVWREVEAQVSLSSDAVFADDGGARQLGTVTGSVAEGYQVTLAVRIDPSTAASADGFSGVSPPAAPPPDGAPAPWGNGTPSRSVPPPFTGASRSGGRRSLASRKPAPH